MGTLSACVPPMEPMMCAAIARRSCKHCFCLQARGACAGSGKQWLHFWHPLPFKSLGATQALDRDKQNTPPSATYHTYLGIP